MHLTLCAVLVFLAGSSRGLEYSDIETLGVSTCPDKNSCDHIGDAIFSLRNCECDNECGKYGDCCIDAPRFPVFNPRGQPKPKCIPQDSTSHEGTYGITRCPRDYDGPTTIRQQCETNDFADPLLSTPVTDMSNRRTYLNRYCAMCNNARDANLKTWSVTCRLNVTTDWDRIVFRDDLEKWGSDQDGEFEECQFRFDRPSGVTGFRGCRSNIVDRCPDGYRRRSHVVACKSYMSVASDNQGRVFKNPHCAVCNGVHAGDIRCFTPDLLLRKSKPFSFALLLDVNLGGGNRVGVSQRCPSGQIFDNFFKKCRNLTCALPGFKIVNGKCVQQ